MPLSGSIANFQQALRVGQNMLNKTVDTGYCNMQFFGEILDILDTRTFWSVECEKIKNFL